MFVLWDKQRNEHVDVEQRDHTVGRLRVRTIDETVNILDGKSGGTRSSRKCRHTSLEAYLGVSYSPEQRFYKFVYV